MGSEQNDIQEGGQDNAPADPAEERLTALIEQIVSKTVGPVVNAAMTNQLKRFKTQEQQPANIEKLVSDAVNKAMAASSQTTSAPADSESPKPNKELLDLREMYERLEKKNLESEARAKAVEEKARWDGARNSIRKSLEAKGVTGIRADAVIALFEKSNILRFDDEGSPQLWVKRSRGKNAQPEELPWEIAEGVDDWSKGPEASEFLPAPAPAGRHGNYGPQPGGQFPGQRRPVNRYEQPAMTVEEAVRRTEERLSNQGVDIAQAMRRSPA